MEFRVASTLASFGGSVSEASGFPATPLLRLRLVTAPPGCPEGSIFRSDRRWIIELPRLSHSLAALSAWLQVAPPPRFKLRLRYVFGLPRRRIFRLCLRPRLRLPLDMTFRPGSSGSDSGFPLCLSQLACLGSLVFRFPRIPNSSGYADRWGLRVSPNPAPSGVAASAFPGRPEFPVAAVPPGVFGFPRVLPLRLGRC